MIEPTDDLALARRMAMGHSPAGREVDACPEWSCGLGLDGGLVELPCEDGGELGREETRSALCRRCMRHRQGGKDPCER